MRAFYKLGIFITALFTLNAIYQAIIYFQLGNKLYELASYPNWLVFSHFLELIVIAILLKYFHHKKYGSVFLTLIAVALVTVFHFVISYTWLQGRAWGTIDQVSFILLLAVGILYGATFVFSNASARPYLKKLGLALCIVLPIVMGLYIFAITTAAAGFNPIIANAFKWIELLASFIPILYILNFLDELRGTATGRFDTAGLMI